MTTNPKQPNHGLVLPLSQSAVMATLVQPFLPAYTPDLANQLQIKKTSFKNIRKFIKSLDKSKLVKSKERDGNETTIIDIDFDDAEFTSFKPYRLPRKDTSAVAKPATIESDISTTGADPSIGQKLVKQDLYKAPVRLLPLFTAAASDTPPSSFYTAAEIKSLLTAYIEHESLTSPKNKRLVNLDPNLATIFDGSSSLDNEVLAKGTVPRDALIDRVLQSCTPFYTIVRIGDETTSSTTKPKAGSPPKIKITLETRSGNKTATKISGLEAYFVSPQRLADELRKTCAGSTSVEPLHGSSPKAPVMEIMVQGPQKDAVIKALERRGVKGQWVEFLDKTKKGKR